MKAVVLVRQDLKMDKGKMSAQCGHAFVDVVLKTDKKKIEKWRQEGAKKIVLKVAHMREMVKYKRLAEEAGLKTAMITDAGKTFFKKATTTCLGIGPDDEDKIDSITGELKMM
ncbi:peptidyl-tRNA hydrolase [archaeon]|jgi:peptidyl-tRNA hydrolase, PTH2 family|nr:peptidyl-tRNA hydrolase [archaeon]MBT4416774.1 peptidyl-tRNA hydrolase [archaeon]